MWHRGHVLSPLQTTAIVTPEDDSSARYSAAANMIPDERARFLSTQRRVSLTSRMLTRALLLEGRLRHQLEDEVRFLHVECC
jgi:hypothetical protein